MPYAGYINGATPLTTGAHPPMQPRPFYRILPYLACFLACVTVDLFYFPHATVFPDEQRILGSAVRLTESGAFWVGADRAWEMPGAALFFTPAVWLFGAQGAIVPIRLIQALLVALQCALIASIARRLFANNLAGLVAAWVAALYPFLIFYQGLLLSETLFNTLLLAGVAALYVWRERGMRIDGALVAACVLFAVATLTKPTLTILPPLLFAATAWLAGIGMRRAITIFAAAACLFAVFMSPWWIRNAAVLGAFVPFTTSSAQNLYLGNNPNNPDAGIDWATNVEPARVATIAALPDELARQSAFAKTARDYIVDNPGAFARAAAKKFVRFWNIAPNAGEFRGIYAVISAASFGPVLALALLAVVRLWRQWRLLTPLYLIIAYFTVVHVVTIASLRYRFPIEPLLIVLAAEPLTAAVDTVRRRTAKSPHAAA
jgi:4-amino-4-deoxy-L-arabinose transferase-like glycosyltransferase